MLDTSGSGLIDESRLCAKSVNDLFRPDGTARTQNRDAGTWPEPAGSHTLVHGQAVGGQVGHGAPSGVTIFAQS